MHTLSVQEVKERALGLSKYLLGRYGDSPSATQLLGILYILKNCVNQVSNGASELITELEKKTVIAETLKPGEKVTVEFTREYAKEMKRIKDDARKFIKNAVVSA